MARSLGVELTEGAVRLLALDAAGKKVRVLQAVSTPILPADDGTPWEARAAKALKDVLAASKIPRGRVVASLDSGHAILREVALPFKTEDQIRKTVRFEMESLIHNYTIEDLVVAHFKTGETDKSSLLLAAAVPKEVVGRTLKVFQEAGLDPAALDLDVCAVFNAVSHAGAVDATVPHLLLFGTTKFTKLVFVESGRPRSIRTIRFSLGEVAPVGASTQAREKGAAGEETTGDSPIVILTEDDARRFTDLDLNAQGELVSILAKEISRFLLASAAGHSPAHILLAGDFEDERAAAMLQSATGLPVRTVDALKAVDPAYAVPSGERVERLTAPLGLALKGAGIDALGMDFRQDEFRFRKKFEAVKTTALVTLELILVLLAAVGLDAFLKRRDLEAARQEVLKHHAALYEDATAEAGVAPTQAYQKMNDLYRKALLERGSTDLPMVESGRTAWIELFQAIQWFQQKYASQKLGGGDLYLEIESVDIQQATNPGNESLTATLRGRIRNHEFAGVLRNEIRSTPLLADADWVGPIQPLEGGLFQFMLKASKSKRDK